jgi:hypothetical protein
MDRSFESVRMWAKEIYYQVAEGEKGLEEGGQDL